MWDLFIHPANFAFSVSLCLMLLLGMLECLLLMLGSTTQGLLEQCLPEHLVEVQQLDTPQSNIDIGQGWWIQLLDWLYLGRIPILVWFIVLLTVYALFGFFVQGMMYFFTQDYFPLWLIAPACFILAMPLIRVCSATLAKILPKDESSAIQIEELIGRTALIVLGEAKLNYPAQARVKDQFGQNHYILVEPETDLVFQQGQHVILTHKTKIGFQAILTSTTQ